MPRSPRIVRLVKRPDGSEEFVGDPVLYRRTMAEVLERGPLVIVGGDEYYAADEVVDEPHTK